MRILSCISWVISKKQSFSINVNEVITCLILWAIFYGMILVPNTAQAQNKPEKQSSNKDVRTTHSKKISQITEKYKNSDYKIPVSFEPNKGQLDPRVKFQAHGL